MILINFSWHSHFLFLHFPCGERGDNIASLQRIFLSSKTGSKFSRHFTLFNFHLARVRQQRQPRDISYFSSNLSRDWGWHKRRFGAGQRRPLVITTQQSSASLNTRSGTPHQASPDVCQNMSSFTTNNYQFWEVLCYTVSFRPWEHSLCHPSMWCVLCWHRPRHLVLIWPPKSMLSKYAPNCSNIMKLCVTSC